METVDTLWPTVEEEGELLQRAHFINPREPIMPGNNDGGPLTPKDVQKIVHTEVSQIFDDKIKKLSKTFVTWKAFAITLISVTLGLLTLTAGVGVPTFNYFNNRFDDVNDGIARNASLIEQVAEGMSSNFLYFMGHHAEEVVRPLSGGAELTEKGEKILASETELVKAIYKLYSREPHILPANVPRIIFTRMEELHEKDLTKECPSAIAERHDIDIFALSAIVMTKAYQIRNEFLPEKVAGK